MGKNYTGLIFLTIFLIMFLLCLLAPERVFSENENRALKSSVDTSAENILSGDFDDDVEIYLTDQFPGRDIMVTVTSDAKKLLGIKEINGVYLGSDSYLITRTTEEDISDDQAEENINALRDFFYSIDIDQINITVMPVPDAGAVLTDMLPRGAAEFDADTRMMQLAEEFSGYNFTDLSKMLTYMNDSGTQVYYRTDHHWTSVAAQAAYSMMRASPGGSSGKSFSAPLVTLSDTFHGSLYSKVMCSDIPYDTIEGPAADSMSDITVSVIGKNGAAETRDSCYDMSCLGKKDKYSVFFGGNYGELRVTSDSVSGRHALVIKDSFANAFVPFMTGDFSEIEMIDLRYFTGDVDAIISERGITDVIVLYELSNLLTDENIPKLAGTAG